MRNRERAKAGAVRSRISVLVIVLLFLIFPVSAQGKSEETKVTKVIEESKMEMKKEDGKVIYLAGGCFWGLELLMHSLEA